LPATTYKFSDGKLLDKDGFPLNNQATRGRICCPNYIPDVPEHRNMRTGEMVTTRSRHREILNRYDLVEFGNDMPRNEIRDEPKGALAADIKESIEQLEQGYIDPEFGPLDNPNADPDLDKIAVPENVRDGQLLRGDVDAELSIAPNYEREQLTIKQD
jgi:hypothetical protein